MTIQAVPYFNFEGNAREAMEFYESVFGGELRIMTFEQMGGLEPGHEAANQVAHAALMGGKANIMASDYLKEFCDGKPYVLGNHQSMAFNGDNIEEGKELFDALSAGGSVNMPFEQQIWGDTYGQVTDKFGMEWSINVHTGEQAQT